MSKIRLDTYLITSQLCQSRSRAQQLIKMGKVNVNDKTITKNNFIVDQTMKIEICNFKYVSRGGLKLEKALFDFKIDLTDKVILDIGASTGGFSDCCLQHNAKFVYALDCGVGQLSEKLQNDKRIKNWEQINLKEIKTLKFEHEIDVIVCDVSFISLRHVFEAIKNLRNKKIKMIFLIKPQFELDEKTMHKNKGVVNSEKQRAIALDNVKKYAKQNGIKLCDLIISPITGLKKNNIEYLGLFEWE